MNDTAFPVYAIQQFREVPAPQFFVGEVSDVGIDDAVQVPHRHEFFEILYLTEGDGVHFIDLTAYEISPPQVFLIAPGQIHYWKALRPVSGQLVLFTTDFLKGTDIDFQRESNLFAEGAAALAPSAMERLQIESLLKQMTQEFEIEATPPGRRTVLTSLLNVLFVFCERLVASPGTATPTGLTRDFLRLVAAGPRADVTVKDYARKLAVSAGYLSTVVRDQSGRTPGEIIRHAIIREAQRILVRTDLSATQVCTMLGFADPSYFSRFFRRECGESPSAFRARFREILAQGVGA